MNITLALFFALILFFSIILLNIAKNDFIEPAQEISTETVPLRAINLGNQASGSFVFGCGSLGNENYYVCYEVLEDGGLKLTKYKTSVTIIYETLKENETAYAEVSINGHGKVVGVKMYVPENAIQTEYSFTE